jgi:hypothetical protein
MQPQRLPRLCPQAKQQWESEQHTAHIVPPAAIRHGKQRSQGQCGDKIRQARQALVQPGAEDQHTGGKRNRNTRKTGQKRNHGGETNITQPTGLISDHGQQGGGTGDQKQPERGITRRPPRNTPVHGIGA